MPRPYHAATPRTGYAARANAQRKAQAKARLAQAALAVALPVATALLLWPHVVGVAKAMAAALAMPTL